MIHKNQLLLVVFGSLFLISSLQGSFKSLASDMQSATSSVVYGGYTGQLLDELFCNPYHADCSKKLDLEKIRLLLTCGANVNIVNDHGVTLFMAVIITDRITLKKKEQIIQVMLSHAKHLKDFLHHKDEDGKSAYLCALDREYLDIMFLLEHQNIDIYALIQFYYDAGELVAMSPLQYASCFGLDRVRAFYADRLKQYFDKASQIKGKSPLDGVKAAISWDQFPSQSSSPVIPPSPL